MANYQLNIDYSSTAQEQVFKEICSGAVRRLMVEGGAGSGKTFICMVAILMRAMRYPNTEHYLLKTDLGALKAAFSKSVMLTLRKSGIPEARNKKRNFTYFLDGETTLYLCNGSVIYLRPIKSPRPLTDRGDTDLHGINAETIYIDEGTSIKYEWFDFFEKRCRSAHECPPMLILTQNPDARSWTDSYFRKGIDPSTLDPLSERTREKSKVMRIEAWENALQDLDYLDALKNGGNATRFYYGVADDSIDFGQIYQYQVVSMPMRMLNIYALDPGYKARTAIVQLGFGGDLSVNIRELCYKQGLLHDDIMAEVQSIIELHAHMYRAILDAILPGHLDKLLNYHRTPYLIVDCARTDLIDDIRKRFGDQIVVLPSKKGERKYYSIERAKKLSIMIDADSRHLINEIQQYRYRNGADDDERVPDGNDDLLDASLYGMRYIVEEALEKHRRLLTFDATLNQLYNRIKTIPYETIDKRRHHTA